MTDYALGVHKRGDSLTFTVDLTITIDDVDETDLSDWGPICQFKKAPDATPVYAPELLDVTGTVLTFGIPATLSETMSGKFKGEVQVVNPAADEGYGTITWPGEDGYITLTMADDVAKIVEAP